MNRLIASFKVIPSKCKSAYFIAFSYAIIATILTFLPLIFGEIILNKVVEVYSGNIITNQFYYIFSSCLVLVLSMFVANLINNFLGAYFNSLSDLIFDQTFVWIGKKSLKLDYETLESVEVKNILEGAINGQNYTGGIGNFVSRFGKGLANLLISLCSIYFLTRLFVSSSDLDVTNNLSLFVNSPWSGFIILLGALLVIVLSTLLTLITAKINNKVYDQMIDANRKFGYLFSLNRESKYFKDIKFYKLDKVILDKMSDCETETRSFLNKVCYYNAIFSSIKIIINVIIIGISYVFISLKAYYGIIAIGGVISIVGSVSSFINSISELFSNVSSMLNTSNVIILFEKFFNIKSKEANSNYTHSIKEIDRNNIIYEFKNVSFKYPSSKEYALNDVSFTLGDKDKTAIVGRNGAGKSTTIKLISRFYTPEKGEILLNGININDFDFNEYQKFIAVVFQDFSLFPLSIKENVSTSNYLDEGKVKDILDSVDFNYEREVNGIDTKLYNTLEDGVSLSGGEEQKIAIARALYKDSPFVLLDEPTSALDPISEAEIYSLFDKLVKNKKAVYISHRMSSTRFCDNIIVLDKGKVVEVGNHGELMKLDNGIYKTLFEKQARYYQS